VSLWELGQTRPTRKYREALERMIEAVQTVLQE
jgi:hypothetical protein